MEPEELQISLMLCTIALVGLFLLQRLCYGPYAMVLGSWHQLPFLPCQGHVLRPSLMLLPCPLLGSPPLELEKPDPVRLVALVILLSCSLNSSHEVGGLGHTRRAEPFPSPPLAQYFPRVDSLPLSWGELPRMLWFECVRVPHPTPAPQLCGGSVMCNTHSQVPPVR